MSRVASRSATIQDFLNHGRRGQLAKTVPYTANNPESIDIPRVYPIDHLRCRLKVDLNISSAVTYKAFGLLNLIESITIRKNSKDVIFYLDARQLAILTMVNTRSGQVPYFSQVTGTGASQKMEANFVIPFNAADPYFSLLDATAASDLTMTVKWKAHSDCYSAGAATVNSIGLDVYTVAVAGGAKGTLGGQGYNYPNRIIDSRVIKVTQTQADLRAELNKQSAYLRFILLALTASDAPSDGIVNSFTIQIGTTTLQVPPAPIVRAEMIDRYGFDAAQALASPAYLTGAYVFDLTTHDSYINQMQAVADPTLSFDLLLNVTQLNAADKILLIADRIIQPTNVA